MSKVGGRKKAKAVKRVKLKASEGLNSNGMKKTKYKLKREKETKECLDKIEKILEEYGCLLNGVPNFTNDGRVVCTVTIIPG